VIGSLLALGWAYRRSLTKLSFNLGLAATEAGLAVLMFAALGGGPEPMDVGNWAPAMGTAIAVNALGAVAVWTVIRISSGEPDRLDTDLLFGLGSTAGTASLGLLTVVILASKPAALGLLAIVGVVLFIAYRYIGMLQQRYANLRQLHGFTSVLAS
jgi:hypothetical protein